MFNALRLQDIRATKDVKRWHMIRVKREQNLAEHSYMVALIAGKLSEVLGQPLTEKEERDVLKLSLLHDIPEVEYGDIPTPTKKKLAEIGMGDVYGVLEAHFWYSRGAKSSPEFHASKRVRDLVRLADMMEATMFYNEEGDDDTIKHRLKYDTIEYAQRKFPDDYKIQALIKEIL